MSKTISDNAVQALVNVFSDGFFTADLGPKMTCVEAESLAKVLAELERGDLAELWIEDHARGDSDPEDYHYAMYITMMEEGKL